MSCRRFCSGQSTFVQYDSTEFNLSSNENKTNELESPNFSRFQQRLDSGSGPGGRRFKSSLPDQIFPSALTPIKRACAPTGNSLVPPLRPKSCLFNLSQAASTAAAEKPNSCRSHYCCNDYYPGAVLGELSTGSRLQLLTFVTRTLN